MSDLAQTKTVAVIGLGTMGLGIVQVFAGAGFRVLATDANPEMRGSALERLKASLAPLVDKGRVTASERDALLGRITLCADLAGLALADLAIEAIVERLEVKQSLFGQLEQHLSPEAILATNTSSLSVGAIAAPLSRPERVVGLHFFNPAPVMRLVELVPHAGTAPWVRERAGEIIGICGKTVVTAPDRPGFIVNRCARPFYGEALAMAEAGLAPKAIDAAMMAAGYRLGPFALIDLIGADINLAATEGLYQAMGQHPRYFPFASLKDRVAQGALGRKSGRGFLFPETVTPDPDPAIALRIESMLANEALWLLAEGGVTREGIDTAVKLGLNFPRGPFEMLDQHGASAVRQVLADLSAQAPDKLKERYAPAPGLAG